MYIIEMMNHGGTVARGLYGSVCPSPYGPEPENVIINSWHDTLRERHTTHAHTCGLIHGRHRAGAHMIEIVHVCPLYGLTATDPDRGHRELNPTYS